MGVPHDRVDCNAENKSRPSRNSQVLDRYFPRANIYFFLPLFSHLMVDQNFSNTGADPEKSERGRGSLASHKGTIYLTENSFKIIQNFTEKGGGGEGERWYP